MFRANVFIVLVLALISAYSIASAEVPQANDDCQFVELQNLLNSPLSFVGRRICTEAIVRVEFEGMGLYTEGHPLGIVRLVNIYPPFGLEEAIERRIYTGDRIFVSGRFQVNEGCLRGYLISRLTEAEYDSLMQANPDEATEIDVRCFTNILPSWFNDAQYEIVEQIPPPDRCRHVDVEAVYTDPSPFQDELVCLDAILEVGEDDLYLVPPALYGHSREGSAELSVRTLHQTHVTELRDGAEVKAVGWLHATETCMEAVAENDEQPCQPILLPMTLQLYDFYYEEETTDGD